MQPRSGELLSHCLFRHLSATPLATDGFLIPSVAAAGEDRALA